MKEVRRDFRRRMVLHLAAVLVLYLLVTMGYDLVVGTDLTDSVSNYISTDSSVRSAEDLSWQVVSDGGMLEVKKLWVADQKIHYTLHGTEPGDVFLVIGKNADETATTAELFRVEKGGKITDVYTGNFSNCRFHLLMNVVFLTIYALICLIELLRFRRKMRYSYDLMYVGGLLIWLTCTVIMQWHTYLNFEYVLFDYYANIQKSAYQFMLYSAPVVWAFCIALSVSNISLIRHERFRLVNVLGILISVFLMIGSLIGFLADKLMFGTTANQIRLINIVMCTYCSVYSLLACLLAGAVISGIAAARHTPSMDCDYIIILGCMIRKDGSLTPLLRGRVDRAAAHARQQEQLTGKRAVLVPSGGQGANEVMAEGEAMKQYLLSQGFPEDQILVEDKSTNTAENMLFSKQLIDARQKDAKIAFATTNYHVFRSGIIATQKDFCPEGMGSRTKWYFWPNAFIREFLGMVFYTKFTLAGVLALLIAFFVMIETMVVR